MKSCERCFFLSGFLAAAAVFAALVALVAATRYASLYSSAQEARPLLREAARLVAEANRSGLGQLLDEMHQLLPVLEKLGEKYSKLYQVMEKYRPLILLAYNETHSKEYNKTMSSLVDEAAKAAVANPLLGPALSGLLMRLAELMHIAQQLSSAALEALNLTSQLPPNETLMLVDKIGNLAAVIEKEAPNLSSPSTINLLIEANRTLESLPRPSMVVAVSVAAAASSGLASALLARHCGGAGERRREN